MEWTSTWHMSLRRFEPRYPEILVDVPVDGADDAALALFELGAEGIEQRDEATLDKGPVPGIATLVASFADRKTAETAAGVLDPAWSPRLSEVVGDAWRDEWKRHFVPFRLTKRITIRPPWEAYQPTESGEIVLELEPGRAFGTGLHATTALVARALDALGDRLVGCDVLDVGAGSGILSLVALALGAARARAIDIDPDAVAVTLENAQRNGFADRLEADATPIDSVATHFDLVVANIEARAIVEMAPLLVPRVGKSGTLVVSGILRSQAGDIARVFKPFELESTTNDGDWSALVFVARA